MIKKIKIWHLIIFMLIVIIFLRGSEILITCEMFVNLVILIFFQKKNISDLLTGEIINQFGAIVFLFLIFLSILLFKNKYCFLQKKISTPHAFIIILFIILSLCPLIAPFNPNLQFNLPMAKNLPPLSSRYLVETLNAKGNSDDSFEEFIQLKKDFNREFVDENFYLSVHNIAFDPINQSLKTQKIIFLFGTDEYGRDVFSRIVFATRLSLFIGVCAVFITLVIGLLLGFLSGFFGGTIDISLNRFTETFLAFPTIFLVILFLAMFGNTLWNVVIVLGFAGWMSMFKIIRGEVLSLKLKNHIITSKKLGMSLQDLLFKEFLPLLLPVIVTNLTFQFSIVIIAESSLSFLGLTGDNTYPTWGAMIQEGQFYLRQAWWISFFPSIFLIFTLLTFNYYGKRLRADVVPTSKSVRI
jgi:peptide/nickel transport system permease protein